MAHESSPLVTVAEPMLPRPYRVVETHAETRDTITLELEPVGGEPLEFTPGQFMMLYAYGVGEVPISVAGAGAGGNLVHTVRAVGAVTTAICALATGDQIGIRGPYGFGWPLDTSAGRDVVVVAGGIGLAPLRPVVHELLADRDRYGAISILYGARTPADLLYEAELHTWRSRFDMEVEVTVDRQTPGWFGDIGVVTTLLSRIEYDVANTVAALCGPEIMMRAVARELLRRGVPGRDIYVSLERNMKCAVGFCGHCQFGPDFVCKDGPVVSYHRVRERMRVPEL